MTTIFENEQFRLSLTGHNFDFVAIMETKTDEPLTFFFSEELVQVKESDGTTYDEWEPDETATEFLEVREGLKEPADDDDWDEAESIAERWIMMYDHVDWLRTRDDKSTGFLADFKDRGMLLAIVKEYCPEKLKEVEESIY